jgi:hypothetical protein
MACVARSIPACFPEQLLCSGDGSSPAAQVGGRFFVVRGVGAAEEVFLIELPFAQ